MISTWCDRPFPSVSGKESTCNAGEETQVQFLDQEDPLDKEMTSQSSIFFPGNPRDRGAWHAAVHGVTELDTI